MGGDFYLAERDGKVVGATGVFPPGTEFLNTFVISHYLFKRVSELATVKNIRRRYSDRSELRSNQIYRSGS